MKRSYTSGPWQAHEWETTSRKGEWDIFAHSSNGNLNGFIGSTSRLPEAEANAHIIAAAPDLVEALELALVALTESVNYDERCPQTMAAVARANSALSKARGGK